MALQFIKSNPHEVRAFVRANHDINGNCSLHGIDEYPNWFTGTPTRYDYSAFCAIVTIYLFLAIAIVCDEYCVPAVERMSYNFDLSYDVAGATLMAGATSAPELFTNVYATFLTEGDMGIGTIVGSAVFNALAITACCCVYTGIDFSIDWWPVTRDLIWYCISVTILAIVLWDDLIFWWESAILIILYIIYVINLLFDSRIQKKLRNRQKRSNLICFVPKGEVKDFVSMVDPNDDDARFNFTRWPVESCWDKFVWLCSYPWECIFILTIPSVRRSCMHNCNLLCIIMSMIWISILTYLCTWSLTVIGYHFFIPDSVMGIIFLAAGTSVPEAISSVIVTKKGYGSMAVCNSVGSNTVDILVCLGIPWFFKALFWPANAEVLAVSIISEGLIYSVTCLYVTALVLYVALLSTRFQLGVAVGILCLITYCTYILIAVTIEMLFFEKRLPHCVHF